MSVSTTTTKMLRVSLGWMVLVLAIRCDASGQQATPSPHPPFMLDVEATASGSVINLTAPQNGLIPLQVIYTGTKPAQGQHEVAKTIQVSLSAFTGEHGDSVIGDILWDCNSQSAKQVLPVKLVVPPTSLIPLCLSVPTLPTAGKYTGRFTITSESEAPLVKLVVLTRAAPPEATVALHRQVVTLDVTRPFWAWRSGREPPTARGGKTDKAPEAERTNQLAAAEKDPDFSVVLREKTGKVVIEGISARLEQVSKSPEGGFDLHKNVDFTLNGKPISDLENWPPTQSGEVYQERTIPVGGQSTIGMRLRDLQPGEYNAVIRFQGANTIEDDAQKLTLTLHVRDSIWWALLYLVGALCVSFIATKVLGSQRQRANLLAQIHALHRPSLASLPQILPVVWVRAVLHQARRLSDRFWLTSPDLIEARVNEVRGIIRLLDQLGQVRARLEDALISLLIKRRATWALDRAVRVFDAAPVDDPTIAKIQADIAAVAEWLDNDIEKQNSGYWKNLEGAIRLLVHEVGSSRSFPVDESDKADMQCLKGALGQNPPKDLDEMIDVNKRYARLRILWDHSSLPDAFNALKKIKDMDGDIEAFFRVTDELDWERLKEQKERVRIQPPASAELEGLQTYNTMLFSVEIGDPLLERSYLIRHKVRYAWSFILTPTPTWRERLCFKRQPKALPPLAPLSIGPRVVQYFPHAGKVTVSVQLRCEGEPPIDVPQEKLQIHAASDFSIFKAFERVEVVSWLVAAAVAIATGLSMFYVKNPTFGSFQDYLALVIWGAGVDQGKNFLQNLQTYSASRPN